MGSVVRATGWLVIAMAIGACGRVGFDPTDDARLDVDAALGPFAAPIAIPLAATAASEQEPSLTEDLLELYLRVDEDLYVSTRAASTDGWGPLVSLTVLNSAAMDGGPVISSDGLTIYFTSDRPGGAGNRDLYVSTRSARGAAWNPPTPITELNTPSEESTPWVSDDGLSGLISRGMPRDVFRISRALVTDPWSPPVPVPSLNTSVIDGGPRYSRSGILLFHTTRPGTGNYDIWSGRGPLEGPFDSLEERTELNSSSIDWDPWISADGRTLVFGSNREGTHDIYMTSR